MKKKKDNNLILLNFSDGRKLYYTSMNRAGKKLGLASTSIDYAITHNNKFITNDDIIVTVEKIDGSEIPYKYINND